MTTGEANQEQRTYWNDHAGPRWVKLQPRLDAQLQPLGRATMHRAEITPGDSVLDVGCGCGQTSLELAGRVGPQGAVTGIDLSLPMVERASERQQNVFLSNLTFLHGDAQTYEFERGCHDLAFSRFRVMFFEDPVAAFSNIRTALRPQGRLCFVCWQGVDKNEWAKIPLEAAAQHVPLPPPAAPGTPGPFAFADHERVKQLLKTAGFTEVHIESYETQLSMGDATSKEDAAEFALEVGPVATLLRDTDPSLRSRVCEALSTALTPYAKHGGVKLGGAVWIVRARTPR